MFNTPPESPENPQRYELRHSRPNFVITPEMQLKLRRLQEYIKQKGNDALNARHLAQQLADENVITRCTNNGRPVGSIHCPYAMCSAQNRVFVIQVYERDRDGELSAHVNVYDDHLKDEHDPQCK